MYKGKGAFLGSGFLPPNAYVTLDCEFILLFRKGKLRKFQPKDALRYESAFTKKQRDEWFSQIWSFKGTRQTASELERRTAAYPEEIAERLIRMFSVKGETVLDPFLGSGTTVKVAIENERNSIGYETDKNLLPCNNQKNRFTMRRCGNNQTLMINRHPFNKCRQKVLILSKKASTNKNPWDLATLPEGSPNQADV